jgi:peroxiredoxin
MNEAQPKRRLAPLVILGLGLLLGLVGGVAIFGGLPRLWPPAATLAGTPGTPAPAAVEGAPAPDFTLTDVSGETIRLSDLKGQVVLINFWATWCIPCKVEMPAIEREFEARRDQGFTVLAIDAAERDADVLDFGAAHGLSFPLLLDPDMVVHDLYRLRGWPTSFFVDRQGMIVEQHVGPLSETLLAGYLAKLELND